jgi:Flp pilus assembly protein TadD
LRSTEIAPQWWTNWNNLGVSYERNKQPKKAEEAYLKAIANGDYYLAYENYANLLLKQKRFSELDKFLKQRALVKFPYNERLNQIYQYLRQQNAD